MVTGRVTAEALTKDGALNFHVVQSAGYYIIGSCSVNMHSLFFPNSNHR